jgi:hypothetical protein
MTRCPICHTAIVQPVTGRSKVYCSGKCRQAGNRLLRRLKSGSPASSSNAGTVAGGGDVLASTAVTGQKE